MSTPIGENIGGPLGGTIGTILGSVFGLLTVHSFLETSILAVVGAVIGFYINKLLKWLHKGK